MTVAKKIDIEVIICISALIAVSSFSVLRAKNFGAGQLSRAIIASNILNTTVPVVTNPVLQVDTASQPTPDGKKKLVMEATHNRRNSVTYVFTTTDGSGGSLAPLFTTTVQASQSASEALSIPFNAWSPDNKYVFIQKNDGDALVFKATGEEIIPGHQYFDVRDLFTVTPRKDTYHETTGWASETLLIINTISENGTKGSSYWLEIPSKAVIQLSSQF